MELNKILNRNKLIVKLKSFFCKMLENYQACLVLHAVGDAMGYSKYSYKKIH